MTPESYIEMPAIIYKASSLKHDENGYVYADQCPLIEVIKKVDPNAIESYSEAVPESDFRDDNKIWTEVRTMSGDDFIVNMRLPAFEELLKKYYAERSH